MEFLHSSGHEKFNYESITELKNRMSELEVELPFSRNYSVLLEPISVRDRVIPNSLAAHPMEGCSATPEGAPGELTYRKYKRFGEGGSGLIWMEATAVKEEGRSNPGQLMLTTKTASKFKKLQKKTMEAASNSLGDDHKPLTVLQLTHSGRYSKPEGTPEPIIAHHSEVLDPQHNLSLDYELISDKELDKLQKRYVETALLASKMGYEAVDIKSCHGYLLNGLLAAHTRPDSKYGGSFENRTRFITKVVKKIKKEVPELILTTRLNVYDAIPYPYGFGMKKDGSLEPDLTEPIKLINQLFDLGVEIVNIATGNPYYNPHVERPFDKNVKGGYIPESHPLENIGENMRITEKIQQSVPDELITIASGLTWLREYISDIGAGLKEENWTDMIGLGRMALAYPDYANDLKNEGKLIKDKMCICCSSCSQMMRFGVESGCPVRDSEVYAPIYRKGREQSQ